MARKPAAVKEPESPETPLEPTAEIITAVALEAPVTPVTFVPASRYAVAVSRRCPWSTVQSAGASWGRAPAILAADDARLPELRRCQWLVVQEA